MIVIVLLSLIIVTGCTRNTAQELDPADIDWAHYNALAESFVMAFMSGDYDAAADMFDRDMTRLMGASGLQKFRPDIIARAGSFVSIYDIDNFTAEGYIICNVTMLHEDSASVLRVVFSVDDQVAGLFIIDYPELPDTDEASSEPVQRNGFTDYPITIGEGTDFPLRGIFSIPDGSAVPVPAVVLVHGSGPSNMDGVPAALANFPNKPFRDIADHLAANGIAVIRYNKRTLTHGIRFPKGATVWEETIEDAIFAADILRADPRIDENNIFIIGHSLGGMLAPRIHAEGGDFAGLILLAGSPRSLLDIIRDQNIDYVNANMEGEEKEVALASLTEEMWNAMVVEPIMNMPADEAKTTPSGFGASVYYEQDLLNHPAIDYINNITQPFLILQGSADFQVTVERDFAKFQEIFAHRSNATLKVYEGLNHLFMVSTTGTIDEYEIPGNVDRRVLEDIVEWIKAQ